MDLSLFSRPPIAAECASAASGLEVAERVADRLYRAVLVAMEAALRATGFAPATLGETFGLFNREFMLRGGLDPRFFAVVHRVEGYFAQPTGLGWTRDTLLAEADEVDALCRALRARLAAAAAASSAAGRAGPPGASSP